MSAPQSHKPELLEIVTADGYPITLSRFNTKEKQPLGDLIVAGATGVPQHFYYNFARYTSSRGFNTITLDYRGVGSSRPETLKGFQASFIDWAALDLAAAVDFIKKEDKPLFMVGHSFGGHAFGLLPNHNHIAGFYVFATGAGWHGWMPLLEGYKVRFLWNVVLPLLTSLKGYAPMSLLGIGEDLPLGVYSQWRYWCTFPHYFFDDSESPEMAEKFAQITTPICAANALDDYWALPCSRDAFIQGYKNSQITCVDLNPREYTQRSIGHMGYFRRQATPLWDEVLEWFKTME